MTSQIPLQGSYIWFDKSGGRFPTSHVFPCLPLPLESTSLIRQISNWFIHIYRNMCSVNVYSILTNQIVALLEWGNVNQWDKKTWFESNPRSGDIWLEFGLSLERCVHIGVFPCQNASADCRVSQPFWPAAPISRFGDPLTLIHSFNMVSVTFGLLNFNKLYHI